MLSSFISCQTSLLRSALIFHLISYQTTVTIGYESMVHVGVIRQTAKLIAVAVRRSKTCKGKDKGKCKGSSNNIRNTTAAAMAKKVYYK